MFEGKQIYLDNSAATRLDEKVLEAMKPYLFEDYAVATSEFAYSQGIEASEALNGAREILAKALKAAPEEFIFTSGSTESSNLALKGVALALGDKKGKLNIHRSEYSGSSSLLKMAKLHKEAFPFSAGETLETIEINTLDNIMQEPDLKDNILLKIDVQGYEDRVIMGSTNILGRIKVIIVETSFNELYEGQPLFSDIYELLYKQGFVYSGSWEELKSPLDGATLQQDSIFIRR